MSKIVFQRNYETLEAYRVNGPDMVMVAIIWVGNADSVNVTFEDRTPARWFPSITAARHWIKDNR